MAENFNPDAAKAAQQATIKKLAASASELNNNKPLGLLTAEGRAADMNLVRKLSELVGNNNPAKPEDGGDALERAALRLYQEYRAGLSEETEEAPAEGNGKPEGPRKEVTLAELLAQAQHGTNDSSEEEKPEA